MATSFLPLALEDTAVAGFIDLIVAFQNSMRFIGFVQHLPESAKFTIHVNSLPLYPGFVDFTTKSVCESICVELTPHVRDDFTVFVVHQSTHGSIAILIECECST